MPLHRTKIGGWFRVRKRVYEIARMRVGYTGSAPIVAQCLVVRKLMHEPRVHIDIKRLGVEDTPRSHRHDDKPKDNDK